MNASCAYHEGSQRKHEGTPILFVMMLILIGVIGWMYIMASGHAQLRHGMSADDAAFCFSGGGALQLSATNPGNGRCATVATMLAHFYIRIQEANGEDVTMFCKEKMACIEQVKQYLRNRGYEIPGVP